MAEASEQLFWRLIREGYSYPEARRREKAAKDARAREIIARGEADLT
jgi:hypothetical protein